MRCYKIRRKSDGLYSTGGQEPTFNSVGKTWSKLSHLKTHLNLDASYKINDGDFYYEANIASYFYTPAENFEIVVFKEEDTLNLKDSLLGISLEIRRSSWN